MKKSIGKKLLAGIVTASMIFGVPVSGYSQEEEIQLVVVEAEESVDVTEAVLAGAGEETETAVPAAEVSEEAVFNVSEEDTEAAAEDILVAAEEGAEEEAPEDGIIMEAAEEDEVLEAADGEPITVNSFTELDDKIKKAAAGGSISLKLSKSYSDSLDLDFGYNTTSYEVSNITIDLGNNTVNAFSSSGGVIVGKGKTLTLTNGTLNGYVRAEGEGAVVNLMSSLTVTSVSYMDCAVEAVNGGTINISGAKIEAHATYADGVWVTNGTVTMDKGASVEAIGSVAAVSIYQDPAMEPKASVTITEASVTSEDVAIYQGGGPGSILKIAGDDTSKVTISGDNGGVSVSSGTLTVTGGEIYSYASDAILLEKTGIVIISGTATGDKEYSTTRIISDNGYAVNSNNVSVSENQGRVKITGGYLRGNNSDNTDVTSSSNANGQTSISMDTIFGSQYMSREYLPNINCVLEWAWGDSNQNYGYYKVKQLTKDNAVAGYYRTYAPDTIYYTLSLYDAVTPSLTTDPNSPRKNDVVVLYKDVTYDSTTEYSISIKRNRTIDLNGHTIQCPKYKPVEVISDSTEVVDVTFRNGKLAGYSDTPALYLGDYANVTLESNVTVSSSNSDAWAVVLKCDSGVVLEAKGPIQAPEANSYAIYTGDGTSLSKPNKITVTSSLTGDKTLLIDDSTEVTLKSGSRLNGGVLMYDGSLIVEDSVITEDAKIINDADPDWTQAAITVVDNVVLQITKGTFTSAEGNVLLVAGKPDSTSFIKGGTFKATNPYVDAVHVDSWGDISTVDITGGVYYPNKYNTMADGVDTATVALVGVTDGNFYVGAYDKVVPALYAANASATKLTVAAAAKSTLLYGFKAHAAILNLTGEDIDVLIGSDNTVTKNKGTLPKSADKEAWIFHNDLVELKAAVNKDATCTLPGVSADCYYCETLKKAYDDADGKTENTTVITAPAKGHTWSAWNANGDRTCSVCGAKEHDASKAQPTAPVYGIAGRPTQVKAKAAGNRKLTVSWKKPTKSKLKKIKGFYIEVATDNAFTNIVRTRKVKKTKTSWTFKKLKKGQRYFVRVRFYKGANFSKWSAVKKRKVK